MNIIEDRIIAILLCIMSTLLVVILFAIYGLERELIKLTTKTTEEVKAVTVNACTLDDLNIGKEISYKGRVYKINGISFNEYKGLDEISIDIEGKKN